MHFRVAERVRSDRAAGVWPQALLRPDNWNDYNYRTMFQLFVYTGPNNPIEIGSVKILSHGQSIGGLTDIPSNFESLPPRFISLGQDHDYYEALQRLGDHISRQVLRALNDIVLFPELREAFEDEDGYRVSLLRFGSAQSALETARRLFEPTEPDRGSDALHIEVETTVGGSLFTIDFDWLAPPQLPSRINAVVGYNGTGKTQLLANLAFISAETGLTAEEGDATSHGRMLANSIGTFSGVIAVSYSAFDTFALPRAAGPDSDRKGATTSYFGYTYVGLRRQPSNTEPEANTLWAPKELDKKFQNALDRARGKERSAGLEEALSILMREPSFLRLGLGPEAFADPAIAALSFARLSTGHKIVLNILVHLVATLQPRMLVLLDEPESHLHPPLVAALLSAIGAALRRYESFGIVATHSPVVLQEIPARQVRILRRHGDITHVERLDTESFAENIGYLTRTVFNLDSSATDFQVILRRLTSDYSLSQIKDMFTGGPSRQGRALLETMATARDDDAET